MKFISAISASFIFLVFLLIIYFIHIKFFIVNVVFYSTLLDGFIATLISGFALWRITFFSIFNIFEKVQLFLIWLLLSYVFAISVPTVIDRSLSFYLLEKLNQRGGSISSDKFDEIIINEYMKEHRLVDIRITEQINSGTILLDNNCVRLTSRGKKIVRFSLFFRKNLLPKKRLIMGEYTDDLTNPFREGDPNEDYNCSNNH
jgi:hypothetical protein